MLLTCCEVQFQHYVVITRCGIVVMNYTNSSRRYIEGEMKKGDANVRSIRRALLQFQRDVFKTLTKPGESFTQQQLADTLKQYQMEIRFLPYDTTYGLSETATVRYHRNVPTAVPPIIPVTQDDDDPEIHPATTTSLSWWDSFQRYYEEDESDQYIHIRVNLDIIIGPDGKKIRTDLPRAMSSATLGLASPTTSGAQRHPLLPL